VERKRESRGEAPLLFLREVARKEGGSFPEGERAVRGVK